MASKSGVKNQLNGRISNKFHRAVSVGDSLYVVWGGDQDGLPKVHDSEEKRRITSNIQHFTPSTGQWVTRGTTGTPPLGVIEYCCTAINDLLYYFGGYCGHDNCYHNSITLLDTVNLQWRELELTDATRPVMRRSGGGMISFEHDGVHHLLMIGGYGSKPAVQLPYYKYNKLTNGNWRTNEHSIYDISSRKWSNPSIIGQCIPSSSGFIIEKINNTRAVLFAGGAKTFTNNIYILEISINTVFWECIKKPEKIDQWPVGRSYHAGAIIITASDSPMLVISGGLDENNDILDDCWIFNITQHSWIKLDVPHSVSKRWGHSLSVFIMSPGCTWIITAGGFTDDSTAMLTELVHHSNGGCLVGDTYDSKLMTSEYYKKKYQQQLQAGRRIWLEEYQKSRKDTADAEQTVLTFIQSLEEREKDKEREAHIYCQQLEQKEKEEAEKDQGIRRYCHLLQEKKRKEAEKEERYHKQLQEKDRELQEKDRKLQEKDRKLQEKDRELQEKNRKLQEKDRELQEKDRELQEKDRELQEKDREHQVVMLELQENQEALQRKDRELQEKDRELRQSEEAVRRLQQQALTDDHWVINDKDEVTLTKEELGRGSYAVVTVGIFRGLRVAVKSLHKIIISDYNRGIFSREMNIASQVRHPNLVQFIGATKVGNPLILTELMSTNLYQELQRNRLTNHQIHSIAQDVALALNYLHLFKPLPIIHRDVSSPNVLLKPCTGPGGYEAKVANYGAAKLQQGTSTGTVMPGNTAYAAPEARDPDQHSPAMDVYSYSVLLMEMNLRCPPGMTTAERKVQSDSVSWSDMKSLIQRGIRAKRNERPTMAQVIESLKRMKT
ncbi:PREDICTED: uncharacterized protein LOC100632541 [Amphimedon queenslandica]|uniref:Protein kinase domain-containing protein n=1 Tax=Amphimedon queenslandica TaxID=400682 RepID=A0AAN0J7T3_AMPQE|nr:PREDICTED: uncharacterized protein LOC100632541 [Amphimedon queenslandica]|eukprot:XP_019852807.1 PREDICTED: uncharacterized protein LOC100632541 [Amphimedon queenslandica]